MSLELERTISMVIPLIAFFSYSALILLGVKSPRSTVAKVFLGYLVLMLIWSFGSLMMRTGVFPGPLAWNRFMLVGMAGVPFVFFHFSHAVLPNRTGFTLQVKLGYAFYLFFVVANLFGLIVKEAYLQSGIFSYTLGPLAKVFALAGGLYILASAIILNGENLRNPASFWANRLLYPSIGSVLMLAGSILNLFPGVGKYPVDITTNTINAFLLTYAIYRYRLLNITITIRKGLIYSILTIMLSGSYLLIIFLLEQVIRPELRYAALAVALPMGALISLLFDPAKNSLRIWIDRVLFREQYDYRETLREFSHLMTSILDLEQLTRSTLDILTKALQISSSALFLLDSDSNFYVHTVSGLDQDVAAGIRLEKTSPLSNWLSQHTEAILTVDEIETRPGFQGLWLREKTDLNDLKAHILVGIKMQKKLIGILILSKKVSGDPFNDDDRSLLLTLANDAAVAIHNALIYTEARTQAVKDELTNLYNYRFFHEFLDKQIALCNRSTEIFSVIFIDLDLFKAYNDIFGHLAGDEALIKFAQGVSNSIRESDVASRCGGDEFAVILPGAGITQALNVAERIRDEVKQSFPGAGNGITLLTVSLGIACYPQHGKNKQQLLSCADRALLNAKQSGRDKVHIFSSLGEQQTGIEDFSNRADTEAERDFLKKQIEAGYLSTIYTLAAAINARDNYTYKHSEMVTSYSVSLAEAFGLSEEQKKRIRHAAMLHDIGKIGIPEYILNKPGSLTTEERDVIQRHVKIAEAIISETPYLREVAPFILHHHEAYDGTGYPCGLQGEEIPLESRILAIADAYHAMTSDRPYRKATTKEEAFQQLQLLAGKQFDPSLVPVFIKTQKQR